MVFVEFLNKEINPMKVIRKIKFGESFYVKPGNGKAKRKVKGAVKLRNEDTTPDPDYYEISGCQDGEMIPVTIFFHAFTGKPLTERC